MAKTPIEAAVKEIVAEWLEARSGLLHNVCDDVAGELGPMIATEVVRGLGQLLTPTDEQRKSLQMQSACLYVAEWLERALPQMSGNIHRAAQSMAQMLLDAAGDDIPFNVRPPIDMPGDEEEPPKANEVEGGDA